MPSRRETLIQNIVARLDAMRTTAGYTYRGKLKSVQRPIHEWEEDGHVVNPIGDTPHILVRARNSGGTPGAIGEWEVKIDIDIEWRVIGQKWSDSDVNAALADTKRALFVGGDTNFGVNATLANWSEDLFDVQTGAPLDGLHFSMNLTYLEEIGNPDLGD